MTHNSHVPNSPILATLTSLALLLLLLATAAPSALAQSDLQDSAYVIRANLPAADVHDLSIKITIPAGMIFDAQSLQASGAASSPALSVGSPNDGTAEVEVRANYGEVDNSQNQDLLLTFRSLVADVEVVENGMLLEPIRAELSYRLENGELRSYSGVMQGVTVIEPNLAIERSFSPSSGWSGDEIACTLRVRHSASSTAPAYDVSIRDALPEGLVYVPGSAQVISGPPGLADAAGPAWSFAEIDGSWSGEQKVELVYMARIADDLLGLESLTCRADLDWTSTAGENPAERSYDIASEGAVQLDPPAPDLQISLSDSPDPIAPGGALSYTIAYENMGGPAKEARIQAAWDESLVFISATPAPDQGSGNSWSLGDLPAGSSGIVEISLRTPADAADGTLLSASANLSAEGADLVEAATTTTIHSQPSRLSIEKTALEEVVRPGGSINYTINYRNDGEGPATGVSITDILDANLVFEQDSCAPAPSEVRIDGEGTHILWNQTAFKAGSLAPGEGGSITFRASLPSEPAHPQFDWVYNSFRIDSNESSGNLQSIQTAVVHSLWVRKKADRDMYMRGETVNYTITYGNELGIEAQKANLTDTLPEDLEYLDADPDPSLIDGKVLFWSLGSLPAGSNGSIQLYCSINRSLTDITFTDEQSVSGVGYMQMQQDFSTAREPKVLFNRVRIEALYDDLRDFDESESVIGLLDALGTEAKLRGHGSGSYSRDDIIILKTNNSSISIISGLSAQHRPSSFSLPGGREIGYTSKWHDTQLSKNRITDSSTSESYMYASYIDRNSTLSLDKNGSTLESETSFEGAGHIGLLKGAASNYNSPSARSPVFESDENYRGSFKVYTKYDEYGKNVSSSRSVQGEGFVSSDRRVSDRQRSQEYGSGSYQAEDEMQTQTNYISKEINASYAPTSFRFTPGFQANASMKWNEGMWSRSGSLTAKGTGSANNNTNSEPASFIGEHFSEAEYLNKSTIASGLNQMSTEAQFQGRGRFQVIYESASSLLEDRIDLYDEYIGRYKISRNVEIAGVARFDEPHLHIVKTGSMGPAGGTLIDYVITVTNDGNRALGSVYIQDIFPPGTDYVRSSLRPSGVTNTSCEWTLQNLGIGESSSIELQLSSTGEQEGFVNRVRATGSYDGSWVRAENYSALKYGWLDCCSSRLLAAKSGSVSRSDSTLVRYTIRLKNLESYAMALSVRDELPEGMTFVNATQPPSERRASILTWNIIDLEPGEARSIDYFARAQRSGIFTNEAHIDASAVDGSRSLSGDISAQVYVPGDIPAPAGSDWQPPACFALNCTSAGSAENWIPCTACSAAMPEPLESSCDSCTTAEE
jgi:uncharacterized repeat protein (TIGR01451 family)/fimbrial isopeptide formation D2 family protein